jgi:hypothetical protein
MPQRVQTTFAAMRAKCAPMPFAAAALLSIVRRASRAGFDRAQIRRTAVAGIHIAGKVTVT